MEPTKIPEIFFSLENPIIYAFLLIITLIIVVVRIKHQYIKPLARRKIDLEVENTQLMALFATMDPDPILRIDSNSIIMEVNNAAKDIFKSHSLVGEHIEVLISNYDEVLDNLLLENNYVTIEKKHYAIASRDIQHLNFTQLYLHDITNRVNHEKLVQEYQESLKKLHQKVEEANEDEKQRIGRELHDSIGYKISLLKLEIQHLIQENIISGDKDGIDVIYSSLDALAIETRDISHQLRPRILNELGLYDALASLIDSVTLNSTIEGHLSTCGEYNKRDLQLELNIYRICQEAISNIIKHSECTIFEIQFFFEPHNIRVIISDNGKGFVLKKELGAGSSSLGLLNMRERAEAFNGTFLLELLEGKGTTIYLNFRINEDE